jgi:hypothetical protein
LVFIILMDILFVTVIIRKMVFKNIFVISDSN